MNNTRQKIREILNSGSFNGDLKFKLLLELLLEIADELAMKNTIAAFSSDEVRGTR